MLVVSLTDLDRPMPPLAVTDAPEALQRVIARCVAKRKADRFASAIELHGELEKLLPGRTGRRFGRRRESLPGTFVVSGERRRSLLWSRSRCRACGRAPARTATCRNRRSVGCRQVVVGTRRRDARTQSKRRVRARRVGGSYREAGPRAAPAPRRTSNRAIRESRRRLFT